MKTDLVVAGYIIHDDKILLIHHGRLNLWLPPGGHIEKNETPDQAILREIKEEVNLDVELLQRSNTPVEGNVKQSLALPFAVNVHPADDHDHCCLFYLCKPKNPEELKINHELKGYEWFSLEDLEKDHVPIDVRNNGIEAFKLFDDIKR